MMEKRVETSLQNQWMTWRNRYSSNGNARETAYQILRDKIIFLDLKPGEPLSDKVLAEQLEMSRTPVREALIILATTNMVVVKPQVGTFVAPIDAEWIEMEQFSRYVLENEVIRLACSTREDRMVETYRNNLALFDYYVESDDPNRIRCLQDLDNGFHGIAFEATGRKDSFFNMLNNMQHIERLRVMSLIYGDARELGDEHRRIAEAVVDGNEALALEYLEHHLNLYRDTIKIAREAYPEYFTIC